MGRDYLCVDGWSASAIEHGGRGWARSAGEGVHGTAGECHCAVKDVGVELMDRWSCVQAAGGAPAFGAGGAAAPAAGIVPPGF